MAPGPKYIEGDLFQSGCEVLVNTVNCVGTMGAGIALQFKHRFPEMFKDYERECQLKALGPGGLLPYQLGSTRGWIINFATKNHWKNPSQLGWIDDGLERLVRWIAVKKPASIAIPALGCKNGKLKWKDVRPLIEKHLGDLEGITIKVYPPKN